MFDWNDLKYFLAVARHGSTIAAGKALGVSQSTVHRRLSELEGRTARELVVRHPAGYRLTEFGEELLPVCRTRRSRRRAACAACRRRRARSPWRHSHDLSRTGRAAAHAAHCALSCAVSEVPGRVRDERPLSRPAQGRGGRRLPVRRYRRRSHRPQDSDSIWAVYASHAYIERHGKPERVEDLARHHLVSFDDSLPNHRVTKWLKAVAPGANIAARNNSVLGLVYAVKSGIGLGPLPTPIADDQEELVRVLGPIPELARSWRLLTHPDLRCTPRVSAFFDFIAEERRALKAIFTG